MAAENPCAKERVWPTGRRTRRGRQPKPHQRPQLGLMPDPGAGPHPERLIWYWPAGAEIPPGFSKVQLRFKPEGTSTYSPLLDWNPDDGDTIGIRGDWGCYRAVAIDSRGRWVSKPSETVRIHPILPFSGATDRRYFPATTTPNNRNAQ